MSPPLKEIVCAIRSLEPFPSIAARVLDLAAQPQVVPRDLIDVIQLDPAITAKVLKLCNSAYYGFQREIASLDEAGNLLGVTTLVNLVLTSTANRYFKQNSETNRESQQRLWRESVTNAIASRLISRRLGYIDPERAYTAGLLQNIGNLVLDRFVDDGATRIDAATRAGHSMIEAEKLALGLHHAEIGARLASQWCLPEVLTDTIRFHHAPEQATVDPVLTATVHLAETVAAARLAGDDTGSLMFEVCEAAFDLTHLGESDFSAIEVHLQQELTRAADLLEI